MEVASAKVGGAVGGEIGGAVGREIGGTVGGAGSLCRCSACLTSSIPFK